MSPTQGISGGGKYGGGKKGMGGKGKRGYGMRAQRVTEGLLLAATFLFDDLRPGYVAFAMLVAQVIWPLASPVALLWATIDRRIPPDRLGNLYFDPNGVRGAAFVSCLALTAAWALRADSRNCCMGLARPVATNL